jgi:hypothetical protein
MSDNAKKWLTIRGFLKSEVYKQLEKALTDKNFTQACYAFVELACSPREIRPLVLFLINFFCQQVLSTNENLLQHVLSIVHVIDESINKKAAIRDNGFQQQITTLMLILAHEKHRNISNSLASSVSRSLPASFDIESIVCTVQPDPYIETNYSFYLSSPLRRKLSAFQHFLNTKDTRFTTLILNTLSTTKTTHDIQPAPFDFVHVITPSQRRHISWYAWDILLRKVIGRNDLVSGYVKNAFDLFIYRFVKKCFSERNNLLTFAAIIACSMSVKSQDVFTPSIKAAVKDVNVVFCEILDIPCLDTNYLFVETPHASHS